MSEHLEYCLKEVKVRLCVQEGTPLFSPEPLLDARSAVDLLADEVRYMDREAVYVINLDTGLKPINYSRVSIGSLNEAMIPMQSMFKSAILSNAGSIIMIHNHPAGSTEVSDADLEATRKVSDAGSLLNIRLLDHIIVAGQSGEQRSIRSEYGYLFRDADRVFTREAGPQKERFIREVTKKMNEMYASDTDEPAFGLETVVKPGITYRGLIRKDIGEGPAPVIDLDRLYQIFTEEYSSGEIDDVFMEKVKDMYEGSPRDVPFKDLDSYEEIRKRLFIRVCDLQSNREMLKECPYTREGDMAVIYYILVGEFSSYMSSARVTNSLMESYGITLEKLHEDAVTSSMEMFPAEIDTLQDILEPYLHTKESHSAKQRMLVVTNEKKLNGAAVMFYPGIQEELAQRLEGDYYIIPSSIHEMMAAPVKEFDASSLRKMLRGANSCALGPGEWLSDDIWIYEEKTGKIRKLEEGEYE